jgi:hypothetical protein
MIRLVHARDMVGELGDVNLHSMPVKGDFINTRHHTTFEVVSVTHIEDGHLGYWAQVLVQDA